MSSLDQAREIDFAEAEARMRRWLTLAARLYPRAWLGTLRRGVRCPDRRFATRLAGVGGCRSRSPGDASEQWNHVVETGRHHGRGPGAAIGGVVALSQPGRYISSASLRYSGDPTRLAATMQEALSRKALSDMIQGPGARPVSRRTHTPADGRGDRNHEAQHHRRAER